jgi:hypothetical protein
MKLQAGFWKNKRGDVVEIELDDNTSMWCEKYTDKNYVYRGDGTRMVWRPDVERYFMDTDTNTDLVEYLGTSISKTESVEDYFGLGRDTEQFTLDNLHNTYYYNDKVDDLESKFNELLNSYARLMGKLNEKVLTKDEVYWIVTGRKPE